MLSKEIIIYFSIFGLTQIDKLQEEQRQSSTKHRIIFIKIKYYKIPLANRIEQDSEPLQELPTSNATQPPSPIATQPPSPIAIQPPSLYKPSVLAERAENAGPSNSFLNTRVLKAKVILFTVNSANGSQKSHSLQVAVTHHSSP